jgi:hypothetical protein
VGEGIGIFPFITRPTSEADLVTWESFSVEKNGRSIKITNYLHLVTMFTFILRVACFGVVFRHSVTFTLEGKYDSDMLLVRHAVGLDRASRCSGLYSESLGFEPRPGEWLTRLRIFVFFLRY